MKRIVTFICLISLFTLTYGQALADDVVAATSEEVVPVVQTPAMVRKLSWDSTDKLFAYMEQDVVLLRSAEAPYRHVASVELPGVLDYSLYYENDTGVQLIAGGSDGTVAVWSVPLGTTPPPSPYLLNQEATLLP